MENHPSLEACLLDSNISPQDPLGSFTSKGPPRKRDIGKDIVLSRKREPGVLPKAVIDILSDMDARGEMVERMVVVREPVSEFAGSLMQFLSGGKYKNAIKNSEYDKMFHLFLYINGRYKLEKNEVITLSDVGKLTWTTDGLDFMRIRLPHEGSDGVEPISVRSILDKTRDHMGPKTFTDYCALSNNCQDFVLAILEANGFAVPHVVSFVKQDASSVFDELPEITQKVAKKLTDAAAVGNNITEAVKTKCVADKERMKIKAKKVSSSVKGEASSVGSSVKGVGNAMKRSLTLGKKGSSQSIE